MTKKQEDTIARVAIVSVVCAVIVALAAIYDCNKCSALLQSKLESLALGFTDGDRGTDAPFDMPTINEFQVFLADANYYHYKIDGKVGPKMIAAMEQYSIDKEASKWDYMYGEQIK